MTIPTVHVEAHYPAKDDDHYGHFGTARIIHQRGDSNGPDAVAGAVAAITSELLDGRADAVSVSSFSLVQGSEDAGFRWMVGPLHQSGDRFALRRALVTHFS